jgi:hypothetical protein
MNITINKLNSIAYNVSSDTNQWSTNNSKPIIYQLILLSKDVFDMFIKTDRIPFEKKEKVFKIYYYLLYAIENPLGKNAIDNIKSCIELYPTLTKTMADIYLQIYRFAFQKNIHMDEYNELSDEEFFLKSYQFY